jgi:hypothetical protein
MLTVGVGFTVIFTVLLSVHPPLTPTTVYVVVDAGDAVGLGQLVQLNPVAGFHVYVAAPPPFNTTELPEHIDGEPGVTVTLSVAATVTVTVAVEVQPELVPVTVYVVVDAGLALGLAQFVQLNPVPGLHV